jgi:hypothetical protein
MNPIERAFDLITRDGPYRARELAVARQNAARSMQEQQEWIYWDDVVSAIDELVSAFTHGAKK